MKSDTHTPRVLIIKSCNTQQGELVPFGAEATGRTRDRGLAYVIDRTNLWGPEAYSAWYGDEVAAGQRRMQEELEAYQQAKAKL